MSAVVPRGWASPNRRNPKAPYPQFAGDRPRSRSRLAALVFVGRLRRFHLRRLFSLHNDANRLDRGIDLAPCFANAIGVVGSVPACEELRGSSEGGDSGDDTD